MALLDSNTRWTEMSNVFSVYKTDGLSIMHDLYRQTFVVKQLQGFHIENICKA